MKATIHKTLAETYYIQTVDYRYQNIVGKGITIESAKKDLSKNIQTLKEKFLKLGKKIPYQLNEKIEYIIIGENI